MHIEIEAGQNTKSILKVSQKIIKTYFENKHVNHALGHEARVPDFTSPEKNSRMAPVPRFYIRAQIVSKTKQVAIDCFLITWKTKSHTIYIPSPLVVDPNKKGFILYSFSNNFSKKA